LSALYVDITKDRMYCDPTDSTRRRATQTAMHRVFDALTRLLAPILAFTADEAWEHAGHDDSVHLETFPKTDPAHSGGEASGSVDELLRLRDLAQVAIDAAVKADEFKKRERAAVTFQLPSEDPARATLESSPEEALEFLMISSFTLETADEASATVAETTESECPRCRRSLALDPDSGVCDRCAAALDASPAPSA